VANSFLNMIIRLAFVLERNPVYCQVGTEFSCNLWINLRLHRDTICGCGGSLLLNVCFNTELTSSVPLCQVTLNYIRNGPRKIK
jgi:hypothetical protein